METSLTKIYVNRELSWLKFNSRVLEESMCPGTPLYERLKFISIFVSNLDEFCMIRVGTLYDQSLLSVPILDTKTHMSPNEQLEAIYSRIRELLAEKDRCYDAVMTALAAEGIEQVRADDLSPEDKSYLVGYFDRELQPLLSPQIVDTRHPFPHLTNLQLHVAVLLQRDGESTLCGLIPVNPALERIVFLPDRRRFILVEELIELFASRIFHMDRVLETVIFAVTRNADINMDERLDERLFTEDQDYRAYMKEILKKRKRLAAVRLEMNHDCSEPFRAYFMDKFRLKPQQIFTTATPIDMRWVYTLPEHMPSTLTKKLSFEPHRSRYPNVLSPNESIIRQVQRRDILLNYPYDSFKPFVDLIREASEDKAVSSIKLTLYRVGRESNLITSLIHAAENGKDVTILLELRARFDEENNLNWAAKLEEAGCRILYGPDGFKVHSKICLITRRDGKLQYVTQIGTGNYNEKTANIYTDYSLLTADPQIAADALQVFNNLGTGTIGGTYRHLLVAPKGLRPTILSLIEGEIEKARAGKPAEIFVKINSLTDNPLLEALVRASQAGVKIRMIVRGICCLRPGIPGYTDNIQIISIVGRYLEHSRVYAFGSGGDRRVYIASADFMTRNMQRRIEIAVPLRDPKIAARVYDDLCTTFSDTYKARELHADGSYTHRQPAPGAKPFDSQNYFRERAAATAEPLSGFRARLRALFGR
ncbi:MAG: polyphosphate kinase 1 [Clostridia bacterium]|nr:polyphosphate kinase 1 [Clostridia bacterium]